MKSPRLVQAGVLVLAAAVAATAAFARQPSSPPQLDPKVNAILEDARKKHDVPAMAAAVVSSQGMKAFGVVGDRKRGDPTPAAAGDKFHIGSDSKAMTAAMLGRLVEEGVLRWDSTVGQSFPELAASMSAELKSVTLEQLLTHRSGLPNEFAERNAWASFAKAGNSRQQRKAVVKKAAAEPMAGKPGEHFAYSNINYVIAAAMAEEATGKPWEDLMREKLFAPLRMTSAGFGAPGKANGKPDQPWPHHADGKPQAPGPQADNVPAMGPAGRIHCSLEDWAKFAADQLKGARGEPALLKPETYKKLHSAPFQGKFYTVGGWAGQAKPQTTLAHDGSNTMNYCSAVLIPDLDLAVLVATNQGTVNGPGQKACHEVREALLKEHAAKGR